MDKRLNIYGRELVPCNLIKITGYKRDGYCTNLEFDRGVHIVCSLVTDEFLDFTKSKGNDLITPNKYFSGLRQGDTWCLCVNRWIEAYKHGKAPPIIGESTDQSVLKYIPQNILSNYLLDNNV